MKKDDATEPPRSATVILGEIRDTDEDSALPAESALDRLNAALHELVSGLRAESFRRDARVTGSLTLTLECAVLKSNAEIADTITVKLPKPPRGKARQMFVTKGGNLVAEKPSQGKLFRDVNEPTAKPAGTQGV